MLKVGQNRAVTQNTMHLNATFRGEVTRMKKLVVRRLETVKTSAATSCSVVVA